MKWSYLTQFPVLILELKCQRNLCMQTFCTEFFTETELITSLLHASLLCVKSPSSNMPFVCVCGFARTKTPFLFAFLCENLGSVSRTSICDVFYCAKLQSRLFIIFSILFFFLVCAEIARSSEIQRHKSPRAMASCPLSTNKWVQAVVESWASCFGVWLSSERVRMCLYVCMCLCMCLCISPAVPLSQWLWVSLPVCIHLCRRVRTNTMYMTVAKVLPLSIVLGMYDTVTDTCFT